MSSPLAPAICLIMLALLGNSLADVVWMPLMDADGNGTTAANFSASNGSMGARNISRVNGSSMGARNASAVTGNPTVDRNASAVNGTSMASRNSSVADGNSMEAQNETVTNTTSMAAHNGSVFKDSMASRNSSAVNGGFTGTRNASIVNGTSMASRNAIFVNGTSVEAQNSSVINGSSVEAQNSSVGNGISTASRNGSAVIGNSTVARDASVANGTSMEARNASVTDGSSVETQNEAVINGSSMAARNASGTNGKSVEAQNSSIILVARVRRHANMEMKQELGKKMPEPDKEVPLLKQETEEEVVPSLKEDHWPSVQAYNQMPKIVPPEVALARFYKAVEIVMRTNATNDKKAKGTDDAANKSLYNDEKKKVDEGKQEEDEADEGKQEEVTEEEWNEEERKEEEEWKEDEEGKKEEEERKKEEEQKIKEWKEEVEGGKKEEGKVEEKGEKGENEEMKEDEERKKEKEWHEEKFGNKNDVEDEQQELLKVPMANHNDEDGQSDKGPMAVGQKNQQVLLFHIRFIVRHRQPENVEEPSEQKFLKTVHVMEFPHIYPVPDCIVVFFDSRTLDPQKDRMGRLLLLGEPRPSFGTNDGANEWAASKVICGPKQRDAFMFELNWLRHLHKDVPMELGLHEKEVRKVLKQKMAEIMAPPPHDEIFKFEHGGG